MDAAKWRKTVAQIEQVIGLLSTIPDGELKNIWKGRLEEILRKTKMKKTGTGLKEEASICNIEYLLRKLSAISLSMKG